MDGKRAVLYLRLSKEDLHKRKEGDDSISIKNQRLLLTEYALAKGYQIVDVYSDDDESGLYDNRPGFELMMEDARLGKFDLVIAKSQSRFSRNMEHIEKYLHHDFPLLGIRFIGVADYADTGNLGNKKARQINGLVNEWYCEDLSDNIRSVFKAKMKAGQFLGSSCPYGYRKDPENHNHLLVDAYAASVVRKIFALYLEGYGKGKIASMLSAEGVLIPTRYKQQVLGVPYSNSKLLPQTKAWSYQTVHTILGNPVYTGILVQNKYNKVSYKDKKKVKMPEESWIIAENTHEPIIDRHIFELAQERQRQRTKSVQGAPNGIFSGRLFCADCKKSMERLYARNGEGRVIGYICKTYKKQGKRFCGSHKILKGELEQAVLRSLNEEMANILTESDREELRRFEACLSNREREETDGQLELLQGQLEKVQKYKKGAFEKYLDNVIMEADYKQYAAQYDGQIQELERHILALSGEGLRKDAKQGTECADGFEGRINLEKLDRRIVSELIDRIEVGADGELTVYYKFRNPWEDSGGDKAP